MSRIRKIADRLKRGYALALLDERLTEQAQELQWSQQSEENLQRKVARLEEERDKALAQVAGYKDATAKVLFETLDEELLVEMSRRLKPVFGFTATRAGWDETVRSMLAKTREKEGAKS